MSAVEAVAEAIWVARHGTDWHSLRKLPRMNRELSIPPTLKQAQAAIAAYEAHLAVQGKVIVDAQDISDVLDHGIIGWQSGERNPVDAYDRLRAALASPVEE